MPVGVRTLLATLLILLFPFGTHAGTVVIFFEGLCNNSMTCVAGQTAQNAIAQQLPASATVISPRPLSAGAFGSGTQPSLQSILSTIAGHNVILVAYSAGHKAMQQMAQAMNADMLKRVTDVVALESPYSGVPATLNRVRQANPNVRFHNYTSGQFGGNHSTLPGNTKVASAIGNLAKAIDDGTTPPSSPLPSTYVATAPLNSGTMSPTSFFSSSQSNPGAGTSYAFAPQQAAPVYQSGQTGASYTSPGGAPIQSASYMPSSGTTLPPLQMMPSPANAIGSYTTVSAVATNATSSAKAAVSASSTATQPVAVTTFTNTPQKQTGVKATTSAKASPASPDIALMFNDIFSQIENILVSILSLLALR